MSAAEWIAQRRELLDAATEGPWRASLLDGVRYEDGSSSYPCGIYPGATQGPPPVLVTNGIDARDAALIADARTSLPRALDALEAVLGMAARGAVGARARGDGDEERRWLDLTIVIESALRADS